MINSILTLRYIIFFIFITLLMLVCSQHASLASPEKIKQVFADRLLQQANFLEAQIAEGEPVRRELRSATSDKQVEATLDKWIGRGNAYAVMYRAIWDYKGKAKSDLTEHLNCYIKFTNSHMKDNAAYTKSVSNNIRNITNQDLEKTLDSLRTSLTKLELIKLRRECDKSNLDRSYLIRDTEVSIQWNSQCYPDEPLDVNGQQKPTYSTVASLIYDDGESEARSFCSGTLISSNIVLTAAHCFCMTGAKQVGGLFYRTARACQSGRYLRQGKLRNALDPRHQRVFFQHAGSFNIKKVIVHPKFRWTGFLPHADLALLVLDKEVRDIQPTPINTIARLRPGTFSTGAGFGYYRPLGKGGVPEQSQRIVEQTGLKFSGDIRTGRCSFLARRRGMVCWVFREKSGNKSLSSTCKGDSGGPLFATHKKKEYLIGVTSAGGAQCRFGSLAYNFSVFHFRHWIGRNVKANTTRRVSAQSTFLRPKVTANQEVCVFCPSCREFRTQHPNSEYSNKDWEITVKSEVAKRMRVSANCTQSILGNDLKLALREITKGKGNNRDEINKDENIIDCDPSPIGQVRSCEVKVQEGQTWKVILKGAADRSCQIVATTFDDLGQTLASR